MGRGNGPHSGQFVQRAIQFALWAESLPKPPTPHEVQGYLDISLNQARKWRNAYLACLPMISREPTSPAAIGTTQERKQS